MKLPNGQPGVSRRPELVGVAEIAVRVGVTAERIRQLARSREMPDPVGHLGRQAVWRWDEVEAWARHTGRLSDGDGAGRQLARVWRRGPAGTLHLVVDELMTWTSGSRGSCHVRVWAPQVGFPNHMLCYLASSMTIRGLASQTRLRSWP